MDGNPNGIERTILNATCRMLYRHGCTPTAGESNIEFIANRLPQLEDTGLSVREIELIAHLCEDLRSAGHRPEYSENMLRFIAENLGRRSTFHDEGFPRVRPRDELDAIERRIAQERLELKRQGPCLIYAPGVTPEMAAAVTAHPSASV